jgi:hypothetical protein
MTLRTWFMTIGNRLPAPRVEQVMRTHIPATALVRPAALAAMALLVAGCGGGATGVQTPQDSTSPTTTESPAPSASPEGSPSAGTPGADEDGGSDPAGTDPATELTIRIDVADDAAPGSAEPADWTLTCAPAGGDHPDPEAACADLEDAGTDAFAEVSDDQVCTHIHGGPEVATVTGRVDGTEVDTEFTKAGGCELERYEEMGAVLAP